MILPPLNRGRVPFGAWAIGVAGGWCAKCLIVMVNSGAALTLKNDYCYSSGIGDKSMGVREETLDLVHEGLSPSQIAQREVVNIKTTLQYINQMVGEGQLGRSKVLSTILVARQKGPIDPQEEQFIHRYGENVSSG